MGARKNLESLIYAGDLNTGTCPNSVEIVKSGLHHVSKPISFLSPQNIIADLKGPNVKYNQRVFKCISVTCLFTLHMHIHFLLLDQISEFLVILCPVRVKAQHQNSQSPLHMQIHKLLNLYPNYLNLIECTSLKRQEVKDTMYQRDLSPKHIECVQNRLKPY